VRAGERFSSIEVVGCQFVTNFERPSRGPAEYSAKSATGLAGWHREGAMPNHETPAERYRRLAGEALDVAENFQRGEHRDVLVQMAQVWQRLADSYSDATTSLFPSVQGEQPVMQQQQQQQPQPKAKDEGEDKA
jgi:hypothetical protein